MFLRNIVISFIAVLVLLSGCSSAKEESSVAEKSMDTAKQSQAQLKNEAETNAVADTDENKTTEKNETVQEKKKLASAKEDSKPQKRMVIYNASLHIEVKDFKKVQDQLEALVSTLNGYVVHANIYHNSENKQSGEITVRIPQEYFQKLITEIDKLSHKVHNRSISGQDVTEEYVDLDSRLTSKKVVEERLLQFLQEAKKTEDLLKISNDLAKVQEEIEQIKGRMKYLNNQVAFSTVTIHMTENKVIVPKIEKEENTLGKTKSLFIGSINGIISFFSLLFIFLIGFSPILILLFVVGLLTWKKLKNKKRSEVNKVDPLPEQNENKK